MKTPKTLMTIALLCLGSTATAVAQQENEELKQRVVAQAQSLNPDDYAFTRTTHTAATFFGKTTKVIRTERFDPTKPAHARWTLVAVNGAPPSAVELRKYRKVAAKRRIVPGYYRIANYFGAPAIASNDAEGKRVLRFASLPQGSVLIQGRDLSQIASAEAAVDTAGVVPLVEQVRFTLTPKQRKLLVGVDRYETTFRYSVGPEGKPVLAETTSDLFGSGLGLEATMHTATTYSEYQPARRSPRP